MTVSRRIVLRKTALNYRSISSLARLNECWRLYALDSQSSDRGDMMYLTSGPMTTTTSSTESGFESGPVKTEQVSALAWWLHLSLPRLHSRSTKTRHRSVIPPKFISLKDGPPTPAFSMGRKKRVAPQYVLWWQVTIGQLAANYPRAAIPGMNFFAEVDLEWLYIVPRWNSMGYGDKWWYVFLRSVTWNENIVYHASKEDHPGLLTTNDPAIFLLYIVYNDSEEEINKGTDPERIEAAKKVLRILSDPKWCWLGW